MLVLGFTATQAAAQDAAAIEAEEVSPEETDESASAAPRGIEIMRVTGRKVTALEAEVPASVTQFDAATIHALGVQNIADVSKFTPNVEIRTAGATAASFFIRGVGLQDFNANAASAVAIYGDDVPLNSPALQLGGLFDLENVEVQRGPQGAGSGRNASAGAIRLHSRKPTGEIGGVLRASLGSYVTGAARNALIQTYEGAVETPIIEGILASRFAFRLRDSDPYMKNGCGGAPPIEDREVFIGGPGHCSGNPARNCPNDLVCERRNEGTCIEIPTRKPELAICGDRDFQRNEASRIPADLPDYVGEKHDWAARGQFRFEPPVTNSTWLLNFHGSRLDQQSTLGQVSGTGGNGQQFGGSTSSGYIEPDQQEEFEEIEQELPSSSLAEHYAALGLNLTRNRPLDRRPYRGDYNRVGQTTLDTWGGFLSGDIEIGSMNVRTTTGYDGYDRSRDTDADFTPDRLFELLFDDRAWQLSQEIRIDGEFEKSFRWEVGGFYLQEELQAENDLLVSVAFQPKLIERAFSQDLWSFGVWAGFEWDFLDDFTLEAGGRFNWERKTFDIQEIDRTVQAAGDVSASSQSHTWQAPTGSLSLIYSFGDTGSAYWKYTRGFKAGHFNSNSADEPPAKSETIDSFETGMRGAWLEDRIRVRGAFFYYRYKNYQVFTFEDNPGRPPTLEIINANDAQVFGAEVDTDIRPLVGWVPDVMDDLLISARFGWLESEYLDFTDVVIRSKGQSKIPVTIDFSGNQLINSPRFKVSGTVSWPFELGYWGTITPRYDFTWSDDIYFNAAEGRGLPDLDGQPKLPEFAVGQKGFALHNLTLSYRPPEGNIEISGWVRNLLDERYKTYAFDASQFSKVVINFVGEPRTIGGDISIRW